jgi:hypothetical protein
MLRHQIGEVSNKFAKGSNKTKYNFPFYTEAIRGLQRELSGLISDKTLFTCEYVIVTDSELNMFDIDQPHNWSLVESQDIDQYRPKVEKFKGTPTLKTFEGLNVNQEMTVTFKAYKVEY